MGKEIKHSFTGWDRLRNSVTRPYRYPHLGAPLLQETRGKRTIYTQRGEFAYSSEENQRVTLRGFGDFLGTHNTERQVQIREGKVAPYALFGTMNANRSDAPVGTQDWTTLLQNAFDNPHDVFNPNTHTSVQESGKIDMNRFAEESKHLFESPVVFMNFEPNGGAIALAELRMAMLASILTGNSLFIRMETARDDIHMTRSRAVADADIEFFKEKFPKIETIEAGDSFEADIPKIKAAMETAKGAVDAKGASAKHALPQKHDRTQDAIVLSGSSRTARDMAIREECKREIAAKTGRTVVDTYNPHFDGNPVSDIQGIHYNHMKQSRLQELEVMYAADEQIVYMGNDSVAPFAQVTTALLIAALTGSNISVLMDHGIDRENYGSSTQRSHVAKAALSEQVYAQMKFAQLIGDFNERGLVPELADQIRTMTDGIDHLVAAFSSR